MLLEGKPDGRLERLDLLLSGGVADQSIDAVERSQGSSPCGIAGPPAARRPCALALLLKLIDMLFISPYVDAAHAVLELEVQHQSAQKNIDQLVTEGILEEITGQRRIVSTPHARSSVSWRKLPHLTNPEQSRPMSRIRLRDEHKVLLADLYTRTRKTLDDLPYTEEFERLHASFLNRTGLNLSRHDVSRHRQRAQSRPTQPKRTNSLRSGHDR